MGKGWGSARLCTGAGAPKTNEQGLTARRQRHPCSKIVAFFCWLGLSAKNREKMSTLNDRLNRQTSPREGGWFG